MRFAAFIHKDPDSAYGVSFPDVPGCYSAGDTFEEAMNKAVQALSGHMAALADEGMTVPSPRALDEIMTDPELADLRKDAAVAFVPFFPDKAQPVRINLSMDKWLVDEIDHAANAEGLTRSRWLSERARQAIMEDR